MGVGKELITKPGPGKKHIKCFILKLRGETNFRSGDDLPGPEGIVDGGGVKDVAVIEGLAVDGEKEPWLALFF